MKETLLTLFAFGLFLTSTFSQDQTASFSKESLIGTWRICYAYDIEDANDTLRFQTATPGCTDNDCGEHQWSFRSSGSIEFIYTKGCNSGFNSKSKNPKRWFYVENDRLIKLISSDGFKDVYFVQDITESTLTIVRRRDLE